MHERFKFTFHKHGNICKCIFMKSMMHMQNGDSLGIKCTQIYQPVIHFPNAQYLFHCKPFTFYCKLVKDRLLTCFDVDIK
ncbi:Hypothetical predicted protein [Octopus vulgaris]|uniref:Uncharacterized protein n=1 Tax=Octopus vulgaris TaxID=6645 RepID=A0AA36BFB3_OCTVU|nr:Hypothetical predicted protein [Octopus vulgaris]